MHQPSYPPSQGQTLSSDMHSHPHASPYSAHQLQPLPSMPPPGNPYPDSAPMAGPGALQSGQPGQSTPSSDAAQPGSSQSQEKPPLTPEQKRQQEINLTPYSSQDDQGRVYS